MSPAKDQKIMRLVTQSAEFYHRLVLLVGPSGSGKTPLLNQLAHANGWRVVNLNLDLSQGLLSLTQRQRPLRVQKLLDGIVEQIDGPVVVLDNTEILFDDSLKLNPLRLLQGISRDRTVVASWSGALVGKHLTYATPEHPEFKQYPSQDLLLVMMDRTGTS
ncbi:MAG: BREX-3 system P-loop-containing protein BrxF [Magnetococcus sp. YQC-3]